MESLIIYETPSTPKIIFDKKANKFEISGNSLPEDVLDCFSPVLKWINEYTKSPNPVTIIDIKLIYFNSASSKAILDLLNMLEPLIEKGFKIEVNWFYLEMDEDMLAMGQEFSGLLKIPFNFISYVQE